MNYLTWIANLGVVPLLRLSLFLFAPAFLCLALRRFSVTAVRDAINNSLWVLNQRSLLITFMLFFVKESLVAQSKNEVFLLLSKGEQREIPLLRAHHYSIGNRSVLSHRHFPSEQKLLIKALKTGFTDLIIWNKGIKQSYKIYVLTNSTFLKMQPILETLKNLNLEFELRGSVMVIKGQIHQRSDYEWLKSLQLKFKDQLYFEVELEKNFKNSLLSEIYLKGFREGMIIHCESFFIHFNCFYQGPSSVDQTYFKNLEKRFFVTFLAESSAFKGRNFKLKMKLILFENLDQRSLDTGLSRLESGLLKVFETGLRSLIEKNQILLAQSKIELSSLAEPELTMTTKNPSEVRIGASIPFQNIQTQNTSIIAPISWRFAGLKIKSELIDEGFGLRLKYQTEFSRPLQGSITGNKKNGDLYLKLETPYKLFEVSYQTVASAERFIPGLGEIPILGKLFSAQDDDHEIKKLVAYVQLEEMK
jgi:hypothetical protein